MSKNSTDDFLSKFANRVEKVGRDGVMGLMKSTGLPINNIKQDYDNIPNYSSFNNKSRYNEMNKNNVDQGNFSLRSHNINNNNSYKNPLRNSAIINMNNFANINNNRNNNINYNSSKTFLSPMNNQNNILIQK